MSAFLVEKKTIDRILSLLSGECRKSEFSTGELAEKLNVNISDSGWRDKLGQKMWGLNQLALGYRYGDEKEDLRYVFEDVSGYTDRYQMFKSLKCCINAVKGRFRKSRFYTKCLVMRYRYIWR